MENKEHSKQMDELVSRFKAARPKLVRDAAAIAMAFFKKSFTDQGFTDRTLRKWPKRIGGVRNNGRGILMDKGALKRAIRIKRADFTTAIIGVDPAIKYADIHNNGGTIELTPSMRRFFWAMYYKYGGSDKSTRGNPTAQFYLRLALKKDSTIKIPKRQFMGYSSQLDTRIGKHLEKELEKIFNP